MHPSTSNVAGFLIFASFLLLNSLKHAPWFDELQAWQLTCSSQTLSELIQLCGQEGHPGLWYLCLYPLSRLNHDPVLLTLFGYVLSLGSLGLLWFASPFSLIEKVLISLSYQLGFNFAVLSRSYTLGVFLSFLWLSTRPNGWNRLGWSLLGLLANVHFFFAAVSLVLALEWLSPWVSRRERIQGFIAYPLGLAISAITLTQAEVQKKVFDFERVFLAVDALGSALLPMASFFDPYYWNLKCQSPLSYGLLSAAAIGWGVYFSRCRLTLVLAASLAIFVLIFFIRVHPGQSWHGGVVWFGFLTLTWLLRQQGKLLGPGWLLLLLLVPQAWCGLKARYWSLITPLSGARASAQWIEQNIAHDQCVVGYPIFPATALAAYLERPLYFVEARGYLTYCPWKGWTDAQSLAKHLNLLLQEKKPLYLALPHGDCDRVLSALKKEPLRVELVGDVSGAMLENFRFFLIREQISPELSPQDKGDQL